MARMVPIMVWEFILEWPILMLVLTGGIFGWACIFSSLSVLVLNKLNSELSVDKFRSPDDETRVVIVESGSESLYRRIFDDMFP